MLWCWVTALVYVHTCSQVRFMLETMLALKNNDMRKIPGYDPEPVERLRKLQRTLVGDYLFFILTTFCLKYPSFLTLVKINLNI